LHIKTGQWNRMTTYTSSIQNSDSECNAGAMNNIMTAT